MDYITVPVPIANVEWLGGLADDFDDYANEGGVYLKPGVLRAMAMCFRRLPLEQMLDPAEKP